MHALWLVVGDTIFFHGPLAQLGINSLRINGIATIDKVVIAEYIVNFYQNLFKFLEQVGLRLIG